MMQHYEWHPDSYPSAAAVLRVESPAPVMHSQRDRHVYKVRLGAQSGRTSYAPCKRNAEWLANLLKRRARVEAEQEALRGKPEITHSTFKRPRSGMSLFLRGSRHDMPVQGVEKNEYACTREAVDDSEALCQRVALDAKAEREEMARLRRKRKGRSIPPTPTVGASRPGKMADRIFSAEQLARVEAENAKYTEAPMGSSAYGIHYRQAQQEQLAEEALNAEVRDVLAAAGADVTPTHADRASRRIFTDEDSHP